MAEVLKEALRPRIEALATRNVVPGLVAVLVGQNPASQIYVKAKAKACEELGMHSEIVERAEMTGEDAPLAEIGKLNSRKDVHGILVQQPLPPGIRAEK